MNKPASHYVTYFALITAYLLAAYLPFFIASNEQVLPLIRENGPYQSLTALAFLLASILLGLAFAIRGNGNAFGKFLTRRNIFVLLLALVFFIGAGEEQSWGQHMFGFEPPEAVAERNIQGEFNLHNLDMLHGVNADGTPKTGLALYLTIGKLFSLFWFGFCVCLPLVATLWSSARLFLQRINMPIVPLWIGMAFPLNHLLSKLIVQITGATGHYVVEVKEMNFAVLFMIFAAWYYANLRQGKKSDP